MSITYNSFAKVAKRLRKNMIMGRDVQGRIPRLIKAISYYITKDGYRRVFFFQGCIVLKLSCLVSSCYENTIPLIVHVY
jgi:hypothetical protein